MRQSEDCQAKGGERKMPKEQKRLKTPHPCVTTQAGRVKHCLYAGDTQANNPHFEGLTPLSFILFTSKGTGQIFVIEQRLNCFPGSGHKVLNG